jgi:Tol biopolymer transport system component
VDVTKPAAEAELVTERIAFYTADMAYLVDLDADTTTIERVADPSTGQDGTRWTVPAGGRPISISPGRKRIAWQVSDENLSFDRRTTQVWVASLDGGDPRGVTTLTRGGLGGWISDDTLLVSGRDSIESQEQVLYALSVAGDRVTELARAERLRSGLLSPDGAWLVYSVTLNQDPTQNGLWLVRTDGTNQRRLDRRLFGSYRWRDSNRLLIVPLQPGAEFHELWELDVETNEARRLTNTEVTPFKIANGDWTVSPDGKHMAFVESRDDNIWLLTLPDWEKHAP